MFFFQLMNFDNFYLFKHFSSSFFVFINRFFVGIFGANVWFFFLNDELWQFIALSRFSFLFSFFPLIVFSLAVLANAWFFFSTDEFLTIFDSFEVYDVNMLCCISMWLSNAITESNTLKHIKIGHGLCGLSMSGGNPWGEMLWLFNSWVQN